MSTSGDIIPPDPDPCSDDEDEDEDEEEENQKNEKFNGFVNTIYQMANQLQVLADQTTEIMKKNGAAPAPPHSGPSILIQQPPDDNANDNANDIAIPNANSGPANNTNKIKRRRGRPIIKKKKKSKPKPPVVKPEPDKINLKIKPRGRPIKKKKSKPPSTTTAVANTRSKSVANASTNSVVNSDNNKGSVGQKSQPPNDANNIANDNSIANSGSDKTTKRRGRGRPIGSYKKKRKINPPPLPEPSVDPPVDPPEPKPPVDPPLPEPPVDPPVEPDPAEDEEDLRLQTGVRILSKMSSLPAHCLSQLLLYVETIEPEIDKTELNEENVEIDFETMTYSNLIKVDEWIDYWVENNGTTTSN